MPLPAAGLASGWATGGLIAANATLIRASKQSLSVGWSKQEERTVISWKQLCLVLMAGLSLRSARAGDLKVTLSKKSELTPVQRLNREGVDALRKNQYQKARSLFYKAYLYDPDDPFTLNNLGYIAELDGQVARAQQFYQLASKEPTDAVIDKASITNMKG